MKIWRSHIASRINLAGERRRQAPSTVGPDQQVQFPESVGYSGEDIRRQIAFIF
jgi:hypothetical protein